MKRVLFYCQHVLGMGHLVRSMQIVGGLKDFDVCFLNGGEMAGGIIPPSNVRFVNLPALSSDADFREIRTASGESIEDVKQQRRAKLLEVLEDFRPDAAIIELFPFGRRKFAFELIPMLDEIRAHHTSTKVVCSLRDIIVSKPDRERYERKVRAIMDDYFHLLLVHSDPQFQRLEESFSSSAQIRCPIEYTGFVVRRPEHPQGVRRHGARIVASIGGGRVGCELLEAVMGASVELEKSLKHHIEIFTGPFLPEDDFSRLNEIAAANPAITLARFTPSLPQRLQQADLAISMAGYNTCMDIIVTGVPALLYPFTGGDNQEQTTRACKLEALGAATVLDSQDLDPKNLAKKILSGLTRGPSKPLNLDIDGVRRTAALLRDLVDTQ
jgi:predicted glycosyltransferase